MTVQTAFTTLSLFNTLRLPLVILPKSLRATVEAMSAMARLQEYLLVPDGEHSMGHEHHDDHGPHGQVALAKATSCHHHANTMRT